MLMLAGTETAGNLSAGTTWVGVDQVLQCMEGMAEGQDGAHNMHTVQESVQALVDADLVRNRKCQLGTQLSVIQHRGTVQALLRDLNACV